MTPALHRKLIEAVAGTVIRHADELTALDRAIGDGDHGLSMKRGFEAVLAEIDKTSALATGEALKAVGMALVMKRLRTQSTGIGDEGIIGCSPKFTKVFSDVEIGRAHV